MSQSGRTLGPRCARPALCCRTSEKLIINVPGWSSPDPLHSVPAWIDVLSGSGNIGRPVDVVVPICSVKHECSMLFERRPLDGINVCVIALGRRRADSAADGEAS